MALSACITLKLRILFIINGLYRILGIESQVLKLLDIMSTVSSSKSSSSNPPSAPQPSSLQFVFTGPPSSGKTSLFSRMSSNTFQPQNNFLPSDYKFRLITHKQQPFKITFWDTASTQTKITPKYYKNADAMFICFNVSVWLSREVVRGKLEEVRQRLKQGGVVKVVGCKGDLLKNGEGENSEEIVRKEAEEYGWEYWRTSSWTGDGVDELFKSSLDQCSNEAKGKSSKKETLKVKSKNNTKSSIGTFKSTPISATSILRYSQQKQQKKQNQTLSQKSQSKVQEESNQQSETQSQQQPQSQLSSQQSSVVSKNSSQVPSKKVSNINQTISSHPTKSVVQQSSSKAYKSKENINTVTSKSSVVSKQQSKNKMESRRQVQPQQKDKILEYPQSD